MNSLPFRVAGVMTDFADAEGIARLAPEGLLLEFQVKDNVIGLLKSAPREVCIPFAELAEVVFKRGILSGALILRARRLTTLASVPGIKENELRLKCKRRYREAARDLASLLNMRILAHDLHEMTGPTSLPTPPPSQDA